MEIRNDNNNNNDNNNLNASNDSSINRRRTTTARKSKKNKIEMSELKDGINVEFENIKYVVQTKAKGKTEEKEVLKEISGKIKAKRVTGLMGPSGSGKTTLLDVLTGNIDANKIEGCIKINNKDLDREKLRSQTAYVAQDDALYPMLTVRETLMYAAQLRLPQSLSTAAKRARVEQVIEQLGLQRAANTRVGDQIIRGVSGGERRRVTIGIELLSKPKLLLLDEPTSGLDSTSALSVLETLHTLAHNFGCTIVLSIHQPNSKLFHLLDHVIFIARGNIVYNGPTNQNLLDYFQSIGHTIPYATNPADFITDLLHHEQTIESLTKNYKQNLQNNDNNNNNEFDNNDNDIENKKQLNDSNNNNTNNNNNNNNSNSSISENEKNEYLNLEDLNEFDNQIDKLLEKRLLEEKENCSCIPCKKLRPRIYATNFIYQLLILMHRNIINTIRTKELFFLRVFIFAFISLVVGSLFFDSEQNQQGALEIFGCLAFLLAGSNFMSLEAISIFLAEREIFRREYMNRSYSIEAFALASTLVAIPFVLVGAIAILVPTYWMTGFDDAINSFFFALFIIFLTLLLARQFCCFISTFVIDHMMGQALGSASFAIMFLFCGFFITRSSIPDYWIWFHYISVFKWELQALAVNQFNDNVGNYDCAGISNFGCSNFENCTLTPQQILAQYDMQDDNKYHSMLVIIGMIVFFQLLTIVVLRLKFRY
eukprot:TRINITY_DN622_c0_g1_i1.p1 TRINITY_DN622_c0_g1~~TRINITY_DN622_c0_g1_i1.p1  ORF type:complete len:709 (-),score=327.95 TRINITY_DN622_c0_g1_i1:57-2183(-)